MPTKVALAVVAYQLIISRTIAWVAHVIVVWARAVRIPVYFFGPTRSAIGCTFTVSQVKPRQPRFHPSSIVASIE